MTMCDGADETSDYKLHKFRTIYEMYEKTLQKYWMELVYTKPQNVTREMGVTYINRHTLETYVYPYPTLAVVCENGEKVSAGALFCEVTEKPTMCGMISLMASLLKCGCCYKHSHIYEGAPAHSAHPPKRECTCICVYETEHCICEHTCDRCCNCSCRHVLRLGLEWLNLEMENK